MIDEAPKTLGDAQRYVAASTMHELEQVSARLQSTIERRDRLADQATIGSLTLNGASVVGVITVLQAGKDALSSLGLDSGDIGRAVIAFIVGAICAVISVWFESRLVSSVAAQQYVYLKKLQTIQSLLQAPYAFDGHDKLKNAMTDARQVGVAEFRFSIAAIIFQNASAGAWIAGIATLAWKCAVHVFH